MHRRIAIALTGIIAAVSGTFDLDSTPNAVGICYSVWHSLGYDGTNAPPDITEIENGVGSYQGDGVFHFWGMPSGGYYQGGNRSVLDRHFAQISGAGIDFIVIDATNLQGYGNYQPGLFTEPTDVLMDEMAVQRNAGNPTPAVVFWCRSESTDADPSAVVQYVSDRYMTNPSYTDFFVTYGGLPLILTTHEVPSQFAGQYTFRSMWGLESISGDNIWSFLQNHEPQDVGTSNGVPEEISVAVAYQADYISDEATSTSRQQGQTFANQWVEAFNVHPKVVMLTWWNEWMAQRQPATSQCDICFVDEFDDEYSKDIEPQDASQPGSHGSFYYSWTAQYIAAYKANQPMPSGLVGY